MSLGILVGASGGIGSACAKALDSSVDLMVLAGRSEARLRATEKMLTATATAVAADIATESGRDAILRAVQVSQLEIGWLVLASGVPLRGSLPQQGLRDIHDTLLTNLVGPALLIRMLLDCRWRPNASIIAIGSISASRALPNRSVYGGSKAGLEHFCRSLAAEVAPLGIRVNVVAPGVIDTPFLGGDRGPLDRWVQTHVPQRRVGAPQDVADVVRFLVLEAPSYMTGARIAVDGGAESVA
jgi:NAD(P)-dependent dehydrogenase (short-subunit alcohol dehydrogenase family)